MAIDRFASFLDPGAPTDGGAGTHRLLLAAGPITAAIQFEQRGTAAGFQTCVFGLAGVPGAGGNVLLPVVISALDIPFGQGWELRTSGLWAEQVREAPFSHWSYGLEAFALAIEDPDELVRRGHGHRVPLGWELDFVAEDDPQPVDVLDGHGSGAGTPPPDLVAFRQAGRVEGILLTGDGESELTGRAERSFWPADRPGHSIPAKLAHRAASRPGAVILPTLYGPWTVEPGGGEASDEPVSGGSPSSGWPSST